MDYARKGFDTLVLNLAKENYERGCNDTFDKVVLSFQTLGKLTPGLTTVCATALALLGHLERDLKAEKTR